MADRPPISRRAFLGGAAGALLAAPLRMPHAHAEYDARAAAFARPVPSRSQFAWQRDELAMFVHFGINTFTDREWGDGTESPQLFNPTQLDARQWARAARAAGFRAMILTAKHHDGFCLWPTATTTHSVAHSPFRSGNGDVVREFVDACRAEGLKPGLYLSPWDRNNPSYGDTDRYNDLYIAQLTELLTHYGVIHEVWFDGANGEGPSGRKQQYEWPRVWGTVRRLQPNAVMFSDAGPDVRWIGNENGVAGITNWSTVDPSIVRVPGMSGDEVMRSLQQGDRNGTVWRPGETDVSIRPGWFHHDAEDAKVRSVDNLVDLYFTSVGRNSKLLLNVPPTRAGLLNEVDVARLAGMRSRLDDLFRDDHAKGARQRFKRSSATTATMEIRLKRPATVSIVDLGEDITKGQRVAKYVLEGFDAGAWRVLSRGTTIGYRRIERISPVSLERVRLTIEDTADSPEPVRFSLH